MQDRALRLRGAGQPEAAAPRIAARVSVSVLGDSDCFGEIPYFEDRGIRISSVVPIMPMTIIEANATALRQSSDACQKQFNRGFVRILLDRIERLSRTNLQMIDEKRKTPQGLS